MSTDPAMGADPLGPGPVVDASVLAEAYRLVDWAGGPLGPAQTWSPALRSAVDLMLGTRFPATLLWGPELVLLYNAAYVPLIADKHPAALGAPARQVFPEVWETIGPLLHGALQGGEPVWVQDAHLPLQRRGRLEECYFTFSYSAVRDRHGQVEGVLDVATETTVAVVERRRTELLAGLAVALVGVSEPEQVVERTLPLLRALPQDLPAVDLRWPGPAGHLPGQFPVMGAAAHGLPDRPSAPLADGLLVEPDGTGGTVAWLAVSQPDPLRVSRADGPLRSPALLVVRLSPHLAPDEVYLGFLRQVAAVLGQALDRVHALDAERRALQAEREGQARVEQVLESMSGAFYSLDRQWRFSYVNAEAEKLMGTPRELALGRVVWELFPDAVGTVIEQTYRQALESGQGAAFEAYYPAPLDAWFDIRVWPGPNGLGVHVLDVTARRAAMQQAEREAGRTALMAQVAAALATSPEAEQPLSQLPQLVVPALGEWCLVSLVDPGRGSWRAGLRDVGSWHVDPDRRALAAQFGTARLGELSDQSATARALTSGRPVVVDTDVEQAARRGFPEPGVALELFRRLRAGAVALLPLTGRDGVLGLLTVATPWPDGLAAGDLATLRELAAQVGLALDNARLYKQQRDLAEQLQRSLLTAPPQPDHAQIVVRYQPAARAAQVGGDWYDAFLTPDGATVLVVGDVVGHDSAAAAAMGQVRGLLRAVAAHTGDGPALVLAGTDRLIETLQVHTTATAVVARLEQTPSEHSQGLTRLRWSNAGHPPPMVLHPDGTVAVLAGPEADLLLGIDPTSARTETVVTVQRGATVLLYTDGLVERRGQSLDVGLSRLQDTLAELAARSLTLDELCDEVLTRLVPRRDEDDVAMIAIRLHPEDRPRPAEAGPQRVPNNVPR